MRVLLRNASFIPVFVLCEDPAWPFGLCFSATYKFAYVSEDTGLN